MLVVDRVPGLIAAISLALLFAVAGLHKLRAFGEFVRTLQAYEVFPAALTRPIGLAVAALELLVAIGLLGSAWRQAACLAGAGLLASYASAIGVNLRRGRRQIDCGCAGFGKRRGISGLLIWRNSALCAALLAVGWFSWSSRPLAWVDIGTVAGGVCAVVLLYLSCDGLLELSQAGAARSVRSRA